MYKELVEEIMSLPITKEYSLLNAIKILNTYGEVNLLQNEDYSLEYKCELSELMESEITPEDLMNVRQGGWFLSEDKKYICKKL